MCPNDCDGKGLCLNGVCSCWNDFLGIDCSIPIQCYSACHEQCAPGLTRSESCEFCKGQCMSLDAHPQVGNHNPFQDVITLQESARLLSPKVALALNVEGNHTDGIEAVDFVASRRHHQEVEVLDLGYAPPP